MEDNNPETTTELAHLAAVMALEPKKHPELTTSEATRRWIDTFSDCA
jgi:hypothetical protein